MFWAQGPEETNFVRSITSQAYSFKLDASVQYDFGAIANYS